MNKDWRWIGAGWALDWLSETGLDDGQRFGLDGVGGLGLAMNWLRGQCLTEDCISTGLTVNWVEGR